MANKIYIAQLDSIPGNIEHNKNRAVEEVKNAIRKKADLIVFPELFLLGYPLGTVLEKYPYIVNQCHCAIEEIARISKNIAVLIGYVEKNHDKFGKPYYNSICYIKNGSIERTIRKTLLESNFEKKESSCFESAEIDVKNRIIELNGEKIGILIGEDAQNDFEFFERNLYKTDIVSTIAPHCDILIVPSCDISRTGKEQIINNLMKSTAEKYKVKYIYVNQAGANDELVFGGMSRMYNEHGKIIAMAKAFEQDNIIVDSVLGGEIKTLPKGIELNKNEFSFDYESDLERTYLAIITAIKGYFSKNGFKRAVLGLSGGLDSSVCAVLLKDALGKENVLGVSMPSKITSNESKSDAQKLADNLKIHYIENPIKETQELLNKNFEEMFNKINWCKRYETSYTNDNIQARSRATILWGIANEYPETIPIATSDKSESYMGYATINGDMSGGFAPIIDVTKTKLFALARWLNKNREEKNAIPTGVIEKPPGAELAINSKTGKPLCAEEALMPYEFLDEVIWRIENYNQTINDMINETFLYEKKNPISKEQKLEWLEKFFRRMQNALYKGYISVPGPIIDKHSINKAEFKQPIVSRINYKGE